MFPQFKNRREAGHMLAARLAHYANRAAVIVLGLPRGGVPVAFEVAQSLNAPLDIILVRKLGTPGQEELALGAIASGGVRVLHDDLVTALHLLPSAIDDITRREQQELARRERAYRGERAALTLHDRTVILVDDGLATGATMFAAIVAVRQQHPARIVLAVPIIASEGLAALDRSVDEIVYILAPQPFYAVGLWYEDFTAPTDDEVSTLLERAASAHSVAVV